MILKFLRLDNESKWLVLETFHFFARVKLWVIFLSFDSLVQNLHHPKIIKNSNQSNKQLVNQIRYVINKVSRMIPWKCMCLERAIVGQILLSRRNISSKLIIGVRKDNLKNFGAHAWLEAQDRTIIGGDEEVNSFNIIYSL